MEAVGKAHGMMMKQQLQNCHQLASDPVRLRRKGSNVGVFLRFIRTEICR
jgi:hypothetical protein